MDAARVRRDDGEQREERLGRFALLSAGARVVQHVVVGVVRRGERFDDLTTVGVRLTLLQILLRSLYCLVYEFKKLRCEIRILCLKIEIFLIT